MDRRPKTRAFAALSLATLTLAASAWTPAFADGNPLDRVGIEHNVYLGCMMRNGGDPQVSPLQRVVEECGFDPGIDTGDFVARYSSLVETDPDLSLAERMAPYRSRYTDSQFSYFERIDRVAASAASAGSQAAADAMFAQLEDEAIAQLTSGTPAEQSILAALSTARRSLEYWSKETGSQKRAGRQPGALRRAPWSKLWKVMVVVMADVFGATAGTLIGGPRTGAAVGAGSSVGAAIVLD